jgi:hypothetical protein
MKNKYIIGTFLFVTSLMQAQNYLGSGGEMGIFGPVYFGTTTSWQTARTTSPGFFSWTIGSGDYAGADDNHHVNGYVKKYGPEAFVFPVGSGTDLRTLSISAPSSPTDVYAVAWIEGNPTTTTDPTNDNATHPVTAVSGAIKAVSTLGQWDWQAVRGTGEGLIITVSIPQLSGAEFSDASLLRLVGWNGTAWENLGSFGASGSTENSTLKGTMKAGIQAIGIGVITVLNSQIEDADKDGIPDSIEGIVNDSDKDGILDYLDPDDDNDGVLTINENPNPNSDSNVDDAQDTDNDGIPDYLDTDDDGDGIPTISEKPDPNGDGNVNDAQDSDKNGIPDYLDSDDDGDSIPTLGENPDPNGDKNTSDAQDTDKDGLPDYLDSDDDNDDIATIDENPDPNADGNTDDAYDHDKNGIPDYLQPNKDGSSEDIVIYNAVAPDGNNPNNAVFTILNIEKYPDNVVTIYDRWGNEVYRTTGYNLSGNVFKGEASSGNRYNNGMRLNEDTYFYVLKYRKNTTESYRERAGYLYLKR